MSPRTPVLLIISQYYPCYRRHANNKKLHCKTGVHIDPPTTINCTVTHMPTWKCIPWKMARNDNYQIWYAYNQKLHCMKPLKPGWCTIKICTSRPMLTWTTTQRKIELNATYQRWPVSNNEFLHYNTSQTGHDYNKMLLRYNRYHHCHVFETIYTVRPVSSWKRVR